MKQCVITLCLLFAVPCFASSLDYEQEATIAAEDARATSKNGDIKALKFALERLTISCNVIQLDGSGLPSVCVTWFSILRDGCGSASQEKTLIQCAQKLRLSTKEEFTPPSAYGSMSYEKNKSLRNSSANDGEYFMHELSQSFKKALASFSKKYQTLTPASLGLREASVARDMLREEWGRFVTAYGRYCDAITNELHRGNRADAFLLLSKLKEFAENRIGV
ncbi:MAG: hypothetical protein WBD99_02090 [Thermodesulfobacteriota bacterium]